MHPLGDFTLLLHLNVQALGYLLVHHIMMPHLLFLTGQPVMFELQAIVLSQQKLKRIFDVVTGVTGGEFELLGYM